MLDEVRQTVALDGLVAGAGAHVKAQGGRVQVGGLDRDDAQTVREARAEDTVGGFLHGLVNLQEILREERIPKQPPGHTLPVTEWI